MTDTIKNYRERIRQADAMAEFALGETLRKIGTHARTRLEALLGEQVYLETVLARGTVTV